ncbi:MAG: hypothetical protein ACX94B_12295 [Henriciella sp.]
MSENPLAPPEPTEFDASPELSSYRLRERYEFRDMDGLHSWVIIGGSGAVHIWAQDLGNHERRFGPYRMEDPYWALIGGIELYFRADPKLSGVSSGVSNKPSNHIDENSIWHVGSSVKFAEQFANEQSIHDIEEHNHQPFFAVCRENYFHSVRTGRGFE